jgi:hypothetical protein
MLSWELDPDESRVMVIAVGDRIVATIAFNLLTTTKARAPLHATAAVATVPNKARATPGRVAANCESATAFSFGERLS